MQWKTVFSFFACQKHAWKASVWLATSRARFSVYRVFFSVLGLYGMNWANQLDVTTTKITGWLPLPLQPHQINCNDSCDSVSILTSQWSERNVSRMPQCKAFCQTVSFHLARRILARCKAVQLCVSSETESKLLYDSCSMELLSAYTALGFLLHDSEHISGLLVACSAEMTILIKSLWDEQYDINSYHIFFLYHDITVIKGIFHSKHDSASFHSFDNVRDLILRKKIFTNWMHLLVRCRLTCVLEGVTCPTMQVNYWMWCDSFSEFDKR